MEDASRPTFASLQALLKKRPASAPGERCDYCATPLTSEHSHLVDMTSRRILCSCRPCYLVMEPQGAANGRYKPVPSRYVALDEMAVADAHWDALQIPIGLAFFFFNSAENAMVAFYPGPAGATQSLLSLESWDAIAAGTPALATLEPDVEAVILQRDKQATRSFIAPDRPGVRAGGPYPHVVARVRRRRRGARPHRRVLRHDRRAQPRAASPRRWADEQPRLRDHGLARRTVRDHAFALAADAHS